MKPDENITQLVRLLVERQQAPPGTVSRGGPQVILFLGRSCADAAGVPDMLAMARQVMRDPDLAAMYADRNLQDDEQLAIAFAEYLAEMTGAQRMRMLQSFYERIPVPAFYQDLALLVKGGYFRHILTTSIDTLLEQALNGAGLWVDKDYQVISLGLKEERKTYGRPGEMSSDRITLVKLHGDLAQNQAAITKEEIADALEPQRYFVKGELSGDLVVVGYEFESQPLNRWLSWVPGDAWWVSEDRPEGDEIAAIESRRNIQYITGQAARPENFFGQLLYLLWRVVAPSEEGVLPAEREAYEETEGFEEDYSDEEYIRSQLHRTKAMLANLEQSAGPDQRNVAWTNQIQYQRQRAADLEDQLRGLESSREHLLDLLQHIDKTVREKADDPNLSTYLKNQVKSVVKEYQRQEPNQVIVSAAIGATLVMAERMGVDKEVLNELSKFAPTAWGRRA